MNVLVAAELAAQPLETITKAYPPQPLVLAGYIIGFGVLPFIAGLIHGKSWRSVLSWTIALSVVSMVLLGGIALAEAAREGWGFGFPGGLVLPLFFTTLLPAVTLASIGISARRRFEGRSNKKLLEVSHHD